MFQLFATQRFLPLFITQFFGAFNDNFLKCAILTMVTFQLATATSDAAMLTNLAAGLFILPYFLFSAIAGELNDHFDKARVCRIVKVIEILLMAAACFALYFQQIPLLLGLLFCMGAQSTFFGPAKYALLPQHLATGELVSGNAFIEGGTFLAILLGSIAGSISVTFAGGTLIAGGTLLALAVVGYLASCFIPAAPPREHRGKLSLNPSTQTWDIIRFAFARPVLRRSILALSVFWMAGSLYISQLPGLCRDVLGANEYVNTLLLVAFSVGIAIGSLLAPRLLQGRVSGKWASAAAAGMGIFTLLLAFATLDKQPSGESLLGVAGVAANARFWLVFASLVGIAIAGGLFSVPLQAMMQHFAPPGAVSRVIAANNIVNALFMAGGSILAALAAKILHAEVSAILFAIALLNLGNAYYARRLRKKTGDKRVPITSASIQKKDSRTE